MGGCVCAGVRRKACGCAARTSDARPYRGDGDAGRWTDGILAHVVMRHYGTRKLWLLH